MLWILGYGLWWQTDERIVSKLVVFKHLARTACTVKYINAAVFFSAKIEPVQKQVSTGLDILFCHNIHKIQFSLCFWTLEPLIDGFYWNLSNKAFQSPKIKPKWNLMNNWFEKKMSCQLSVIYSQLTFIPTTLIPWTFIPNDTYT